MEYRNSYRGGGASNGARNATSKDRIAMAAGWEVANLIPDRVYSLMGIWLVHYWETDSLRPNRFETLQPIVHSLGTLSEARAISEEAGAAVANAFLGALVLRGYSLPAEARETIERWFSEGHSDDPQHLLNSSHGLGDPKHVPTPPRPVCRHCGAAQ